MRNGFPKAAKSIALFLLLSATFVFSLSVAHARSIPPVLGLEMLRRSFLGMRDFTAEITQDKQISLMKKKMTASGVVRFRKPDTFYMELYSPYASRLLLRDTLLTMVLPSEGVRQKIVLPREESLKRWLNFLDKPVTSLPAGADVSADVRGRNVTLQIIPRKNGAMSSFQM